jgi:hypothetical protein
MIKVYILHFLIANFILSSNAVLYKNTKPKNHFKLDERFPFDGNSDYTIEVANEDDLINIIGNMKEESNFFEFRESLRSDKKILQIYQKVMSPQTRKYKFKNGQQNSPNTKKENLMQNFDCKKNSLKVAPKRYGDPSQYRIISSDKFIDNQFKRSNFTNTQKKINKKNNQDFQSKFLRKRIDSLKSNQPSNNLMTQYRNNSKNDLITQKSDLVLKQKLEIQHKNHSFFKKVIIFESKS